MTAILSYGFGVLQTINLLWGFCVIANQKFCYKNNVIKNGKKDVLLEMYPHKSLFFTRFNHCVIWEKETCH